MNRIKGLILKVLRGEATAAEQLEVDAWLQESPDNQTLFEEINDPVRVGEALAKMDALHEEAIWQRLQVQTAAYRQLFQAPRRKAWTWLAAAAVVLVLGIGGWLWKESRSPQTPAATLDVTRDVPPGRNQAILTLANGSTILLDSARSGALAQQGGSRVIKTDSGQLAYDNLGERPTAILYNTLATPRGGQYQLRLPDGTKVWLNAASSIRYPVAFIGAERRVQITGEAYFEVAKNVSLPFIVDVIGKEKVAVLGTSFNINAYGDEPALKTTLLEGAVSVAVADDLVGVNTNKEKPSVVLKPGERALLVVGDHAKEGEKRLTIDNKADIEEAIAWKNGKFIFSGDDIGSVMRQIGRWYNVDVEYKGDFKGVELVGVISRSKNVSEMLRMLEQTRTVQFNIEDRKITVFPYKN